MALPLAIAIGSLILGIGKEVLGAKAQNDASKANKAEAIRVSRETAQAISLQQIQQRQATSRTIYQTDRDARSAQALASVSAGEAGVEGLSVEALLGDLDRKRAEFTSTEGRNLDVALVELEREKKSGRSIAQGRIAAVPKANPFAVGIGIAGVGLAFWAGQIGHKPSSSQD